MTKHIIEIVSILGTLIAVIHFYMYSNHDLRKLVLFFSGSMVLGTIAEAAAILSTESYLYRGFLWYIGPVPVFVAIGWCATFYMTFLIGKQLVLPSEGQPHFLWKLGLSAGLTGVVLDLCFDPVAHLLGLWEWKNGSFYYGIPISNYIGWFFFCGGFAMAYHHVTRNGKSGAREFGMFYLWLVGVFAVTAASSFPFLNSF